MRSTKHLSLEIHILTGRQRLRQCSPLKPLKEICVGGSRMWFGKLASLIMSSFTAHIHKFNTLQVTESKGQYFLKSGFLPTDWKWVFLYVLGKKSSSATNPSASPAASMPGLWYKEYRDRARCLDWESQSKRCMYTGQGIGLSKGGKLKAGGHSGLVLEVITRQRVEIRQAMRSLEAHGYQRARQESNCTIKVQWMWRQSPSYTTYQICDVW